MLPGPQTFMSLMVKSIETVIVIHNCLTLLLSTLNLQNSKQNEPRQLDLHELDSTLPVIVSSYC